MSAQHSPRWSRPRTKLAVGARVVLGAGAATVLCGALPVTTASAQATVSISPDPVPIVAAPSHRDVTVSWSGLAPSALVFVDVCKKSIAEPTFDVSEDCSTLSRQTPNGTPSGSNSIPFEVFRGRNPDGETPWGCFAPGDVPPPGVEAFTQCYVRVTDRVVTNYDSDSEAVLRFVDGPDGSPGSTGSGLVRPTPIYSGDPDGQEGASATSAVSPEELAALQVGAADSRSGIAIVG